jgi:DNA-binding transcriptional MocR family regulator
MWLPKQINTDLALYKAIADALERDIHLGKLNPNDRLPPQRQLAHAIGVNLTTVTRAYREAHNRGLIETRKGDGTYVKVLTETLKIPSLGPKHQSDPIELGFVNPGIADLTPLLRSIRKIGSDTKLMDIYNYVESQGLWRHRQTAANWLSQYGFRNLNANQIIIAGGATNAINCTLIGLFQPGDAIAVDPLTFPGFIHAAKLSGIHLVAIPSDIEGMLPNALERACLTENIKGVYLMPNMQNPTSTCMTDRRKQALANIIRVHGLRLIEDDVFAFTNLESTTSLSALIPQNSIYICGFSKTLYPSLRVAYVKVSDGDYNAFLSALIHTVWMASPLNVEILSKLIESGDIQKVAVGIRAAISARQQLARLYLADFDLSPNRESMYLWLMLPEGWHADTFENAALRSGIHIISSKKFYAGTGNCPDAIRIALTTEPDDERFREGILKLSALLHQSPTVIDAVM